MREKTRFVNRGLRVIDELRHDDAELASVLRTDAGESLFFQRQLESIESRVYLKKFRELKYRELIPVSNRDQAGAAFVIYYLYTRIGMAKIIANPSDDLPRADAFAEENIVKVFSIGESFGYSTKELRRAAMSGAPMEMLKVDALRRGFREKESSIAWSGDAEHNIIGVFDNPNIPQDQAPQGASTLRDWANKTPDEILDDISFITSQITDVTNDVHEANTLCLPIAQHNLIAKKPRSATTDTTILGFVTDPKNGFGLDRIERLPECKGVGPAGSDVMLAYERTPEVLEIRIPMELQLLPPERRNLEFLVNAESEIAGTTVRYPLAMRTMYDI